MLCLSLTMIACAGIDQSEVPPDERYGHRYASAELENEEVLELAAETDEPYFVYDLPVREVAVRKGTVATAEEQVADTLDVSTGVPVDILIRGALPDHCLELHNVSQRKSGQYIDIKIEMRRPRQETCRQMRRPFRLYVEIEEELEPGAYTLMVNGEHHPFEIRDPAD